MLSYAVSYAALARWLGPWAGETAMPGGIDRQRLTVDPSGPNALEAWLYRPSRGRPRRMFVIAPGLHFLGPDDPRMDRFCRILAASGAVVISPFIPDYLALRVTPQAIADFQRVIVAAREHPERPEGSAPAIFSVSFGSLLALRAATTPALASDIGALMIFGGYADWNETVRFCLTGELNGQPHGHHDPLNRPVVFMNLLATMRGVPENSDRIVQAWHAYCERTWGRAEYKRGTAHHAVAREIAESLPVALQATFLEGCGVTAGGFERCMDALARAGTAYDFLDPKPFLSTLRCPVFLFHGVDDDVIPYLQLDRLKAALPESVRIGAYLTGMYGHTSQSGVASSLRQLPTLVHELSTMAKMLSVLSRGH